MTHREQREARRDLFRHSTSWTQKRFLHKREKVVGLVGLNFRSWCKEQRGDGTLEVFNCNTSWDTMSAFDLVHLGSEPRILLLLFYLLL